jgi:pyruvate dehydrogenase (quinone)
VIGLPGDIALRDAGGGEAWTRLAQPASSVCPPDAEVTALAAMLNGARKITILGGAGCADAHAELIELASRLKAPIVHAMRGRSSSSLTTRSTSG